VPWLTITSSGLGTATGPTTYTVAPNPTTAQRTGTMTIAGQTVTITELGMAGAPLAPTNFRVTAN
jgi:hypothetical protein